MSNNDVRHRSFHDASRTGHYLVSILVVLIILMMVGHSLLRVPSHGIRVDIARPANAGPLWPNDPVLVTVRSLGRGVPVVLFINSRQVASADFDQALEQQRVTRPPEWPIYLAGEGDLVWHDMVPVIDRIKGLGVRVALVTQRTPRSDARPAQSNRVP